MSSTDVKIERQVKRHRPSLIGIAAAVIFAGVAFVGVMMFGVGPEIDEAGSGEPTDESQPMISE